MDAIEALMSRRSYARGNLIEPAPSEIELETILQAAMTAPDHGNLKPWRFVVVSGQGIRDLSLLVKEKYATSMSEEHLEAFVREIASTPMMIFVCSNIVLDHHVSALDQYLAGGAACEHILLAAHALGFAGIWHSLDADVGLRHMIQLKPEDEFLGVLSIGTPKHISKAKRKPFSNYTQTWNREYGLQKWIRVSTK